MSFYHDIHFVKNSDGEINPIEVEYSREECIRRGWLDPDKNQWIREWVSPPDAFPDLYKSSPIRDRLFGKNF